ncbi:hypothetical protein EET67_25110 [Pseudaminobacter arsenicus]|uniref:PD-(D/E)XK nuclease superfamily protein n=1 Tax=Borborobacter arsenicus TaxID=1851146 RepID=A0A432UYY0_9HYPH|nr:hypothetical protein [Pseudaminobacter arsenicus]RUM95119.1 hypothetical protein EET67_25110 [Pseudaminobacter arsenicus]
MEGLRKSAQEVEIDHLLAEEFSCDASFAGRFLSACRPQLSCPDFRVSMAVPGPSLGGEGFGDILVEGDAGELRVALLIEDKITAGPGVRQAERYLAYAERMRGMGWDQVWCILAAPASYRGEREEYDASIDLETVARLLRSPDLKRVAYRRAIIERALRKRATSGVTIPDPALHRMKADYLHFVARWCAAEDLALSFPPLRDSYYDGDSWIDPIRHSRLPDHVWLRHRLWTSVKAPAGQIDLIAKTADAAEHLRFRLERPDGAVTTQFSKGKGVQISLPLPEMRQGSGFDAKIASEACHAMRTLVRWYIDKAGSESS